MRALLVSLALLAAGATLAAAQSVGANEAPNEAIGPAGAVIESNAAMRARDPFVRTSDECGASRYAHLLGEQFATLEQAALPANAAVQRAGPNRRTLEYTPGKLNVVLDTAGRIAVIGCF